jgi:hypothetical protein
MNLDKLDPNCSADAIGAPESRRSRSSRIVIAGKSDVP